MMILDAALAQLETAQLVRRLSDIDPSYIFKHVLTQDSAYQSLLVKQRREIHRYVAQAYEALYADRCVDEFAVLLAQHYAAAGDDTQVVRYAILAGDAAARTYANAEAIAFYTQAIEIDKRSNGALLQALYLKRGRIHELSDHFDAALANYDEMESLARTRGDRAMELASLIARATVHAIPSEHFDIARAKLLCAQALDLARALSDQPSEAKILWNMILFNSRLDTNYRQALEYGEQAIAIARAHGLREQLAYLLNDVSMVYVWSGEPERGGECNLEARAMFREMNNLPMLTDNLGYAIMRHITIGENVQAIELAREALQVSQRIGNVWGETFSESWIGEAHRELGEIDQAIRVMQHSIQLAEHSFQAPLAFTRSDLGALYGDLGQVEQGLSLAQLARDIGERISNVMHIYCAGQIAHLQIIGGDLASAQSTVSEGLGRAKPGDEDSMFGFVIFESNAELQLALGNYPQAIQACDRLINRLRAYRLHQHLANVLWLKGLALTRQGKFDDAFACLQDARHVAEQTQSRWMLWRILAALANIEMGRGNSEQAQTFRTQAREIVEYIVAHTPPDLRASFLNLPTVREVME